ncbi:hypothetical protein ACOSQ3_012798 [Xanthoceras sorbifolium]
MIMAVAIFTIYFITSTSTILAASTVIPTRPQRLIIELIHRDSIRFPYHNRNENVSDRVERAMKTSISRFAYLQAKIIKSSSWNENYEAGILPSINSSLFFMNFSIGRPPIPQFTIMDTGSSLLWVQCLPCNKCYKQFGPTFDPSKSSTYSELPCNSPYCRYSPGSACNLFGKCSYNLTYMDGFSSSGILARETLTFKASDEGRISLPGTMIFGCGHDNGMFHDRQVTGVFGLGFGKLSLVSHLASSFSYCIGNLHDPNYIHNKLVLGHGARIEGDSTPLEVINGRYYITLEGISVGERKLEIDPKIFKRKTNIGKDGVVIDTGSPATWLVKPGFEALREEVKALLDVWLTRSYWFDSWTVCYEGVISRDVVGFPAVTFHFADGADLVLDRESLFLQAWPNVFCMAVFPSFADHDHHETNLSLVGMMAQQNYNVAFDVSGKKVTFQRIDCELLDD